MAPWQGVYKSVEMLWLRWETLNGELVLTGQEAAEQRAARLAKNCGRWESIRMTLGDDQL